MTVKEPFALGKYLKCFRATRTLVCTHIEFHRFISGEMIIFRSILTTFIARGSSKNWLEPYSQQPLANLAYPNLWNTLYRKKLTSTFSSMQSFEMMYLWVDELTLTSHELTGLFHKMSLQTWRSNSPWNQLKKNDQMLSFSLSLCIVLSVSIIYLSIFLSFFLSAYFSFSLNLPIVVRF